MSWTIRELEIRRSLEAEHLSVDGGPKFRGVAARFVGNSSLMKGGRLSDIRPILCL
jgi:hypothetical protein